MSLQLSETSLEDNLKKLKFREILETNNLNLEILGFYVSQWNFDISYLFLNEIFSLGKISSVIVQVLVVVLRFMKIPKTDAGKEKFKKIMTEIMSKFKKKSLILEVLQEKFTDFVKISLKSVKKHLKYSQNSGKNDLKIKILAKFLEKSQNTQESEEIIKYLRKFHKGNNLLLQHFEIFRILPKKVIKKQLNDFLDKLLYQDLQVMKREKFYEISEIRNSFLKVFMEVYNQKIQTRESLGLLGLLEQFPVYYFNAKEEKKILSILITADELYSRDRSTDGLALVRRLLVKYAKRCQYHEVLSVSTDFFIYLLHSVDHLVGLEDIRWNTVSLVTDILVKLCIPTLKKDFLTKLVEYRNQLVLNGEMQKAVYWDFALFSSIYQLMSRKGFRQEQESFLLGPIKIQELSASVLESVLSGSFESKVDLMVVNQGLGLLEKCGLADSVVSCTQKVICIFKSSPIAQPSAANSLFFF